MNQSNPLVYYPPPEHAISRDPSLQPTMGRVKCAFPGCGKLFNRKEHLTRHLKSHDPQRQHECLMCGRRYARSDVLKRHIEHHTQDSHPRRILVACVSCHERKLKCDDSIPCRSCTRNATECTRLGLDGESTRPDINNGNRNEMIAGDDRMLTNEINGSNEMSTLLENNDRPQPWFQSQETWSLPATRLNTSLSSNLNADSPVQWAVNPHERRRIIEAFPAATPEDTIFSLPSTNDPRVQCLSSASWHDAGQCDRTVSSLASQSSPTSKISQDDDVTDLYSCLDKESSTTKRSIQVYFTEIHPYWPLLHAPTFDTGPNPASYVLLGSMVLLASWLEGEPTHIKLAPLVFDAVTAAILESNPPLGKAVEPPSLHTLQALLLCVVYSTYRLTAEGMLAQAVYFNGILISTCRHLGVFSGQHAYHDLGDCPFGLWLAQEQLHRLAFSVLCIDAYLSVLLDHPPSVRYQELCIPLPKSPQLWTAASDNERRSLQWNEPAGREKTLLCFLMRDTLDFNRKRHLPHHLTEVDYNLVLCSLQVGIWEAAREFHSCESDELAAGCKPTDRVGVWRTHLNSWRASRESGCLTRKNYSSASASSTDNVSNPISLVLWHISVLTLHAPLKLLQRQGCCFKCRTDTAISARKTKTRLRAWAASADARIAVWNAAQISRIVGHESDGSKSPIHLLLNPLAVPAVLKSAVVICSYAYYTSACPICTGVPSIDLVDLFGAKDDDLKLRKWKEQGEGLADWSPVGIPVCRCKVMALATWFRGQLAMDASAERQLMEFLRGLDKI